MKPETKDSLRRILFGVAISIPITLFLYNTVGVLLIKLIFDEQTIKATEAYTPVYLTLAFFYPLVCNFAYITRLSETAEIPTGNKFNWQEDISHYLQTEGKILLLVYAVFAVLFETAYLLSGDGLDIVSAIFLFCFPLAYTIPIPVLRTVIAYAVTMILLFALIFLNRKINFHKWN